MTLQLASTMQEELEGHLHDSGHLRTLAFLYASKGMYTKSLDVWRALALNLSNGSRKDALLRWDVQYPSTKFTQKDAATQASHLLEESSDKSIVLQHLEWVGSGFLVGLTKLNSLY